MGCVRGEGEEKRETLYNIECSIRISRRRKCCFGSIMVVPRIWTSLESCFCRRGDRSKYLWMTLDRKQSWDVVLYSREDRVKDYGLIVNSSKVHFAYILLVVEEQRPQL